jgi:hypothetical protein
MSQYVPKEQLWTEFMGSLEFEYDHSVYWPALHKLCEEKRASRKQRWELGGKQIGEFEDYLAGSLEHGVVPAKDGAESPDMEIDAKELTEKLQSVKVTDENPTVVEHPNPSVPGSPFQAAEDQ